MAEVSVVIPTLRRYGELSRVLDALGGQDVSQDAFELVLASDAKEPEPERVAATLEGRPYPTLHVIAEIPGASGARNSGWRAARARLTLFLDDDVVPDLGLVREHLAWHRTHRADEIGVLGHVSWARELRVTPFMRWLDQGLQFGFASIEGTEARWSHLYTANVSLKRVMLERVGGFDEQEFPFGYEDLDLARRLMPLGFRLLYNRSASAEHLHAAAVEEWRGTVARIATAEHDFVRRYPECEPFFHKVLTRPMGVSPLWRHAAPLASVVPRDVRWLGPRVWAGAAASYRRRLAPSFLAAWERADAAAD